jgi:predicted TPR repeat methyltransferase
VDPIQTGNQYNAIVHLWEEQHKDSSYGIESLMRAIEYCNQFDYQRKIALDIGCGSGGRMMRLLVQHGFGIVGLDISESMLTLAKQKHPEFIFHHADICTWQTQEQFQCIIAWDSIFHVPYDQQEQVLIKLCSMLVKDGILLFTCGDDIGYHLSEWQDMTFYYSSLGINRTLEILMQNNCDIRHVELDQFPQKHAVIIAKKY